ncbi:DUF4166 domain-containing protein [Shimia haliotis]|uniref:DUF4166 domain-containing protein n=1 Tax=Shimia haliotis TaxID=1280847 RepID=A0A1I4DWY7_9RHOB|nr:DUF4166 domain-containing protein [Shimia haliotis]SFK97479.1 protein of unknown function [Shimia haliotis]
MTLYARWLGCGLNALAPECGVVHRQMGPFTGEMTVRYGQLPFAEILFVAIGFPRACEAAPLVLTKQADGNAEIWVRQVAGHNMQSRLWLDGQKLSEALGPVRVDSVAEVSDDGLRLRIVEVRVRGVRVPRGLWRNTRMREWANSGRYHFEVVAALPVLGWPVLTYQGWLAPGEKRSDVTA